MRQPVCHLRSDAEYCHQLDVELIDAMHKRDASQESRLRLEQACQIHEPVILNTLLTLGYDESTVTLLFVVPLVQVAWADGSVNQIERDHVLAIAGLRGLKANTPAYERLTSWLARRPPDEFFEGHLRAIKAILSSLSPADAKAMKDAIMLCCHDAAVVPCHFVGSLTRICAANREAIETISKRLETADQELDQETECLTLLSMRVR